jgi:hypothetical protein
MVDSEVQTRFLGADSILYATAHRPWPLPDSQWLMTQTWNDLLFAHYALKPSIVRALVPEQLTLDLYDGAAWSPSGSRIFVRPACRRCPLSRTSLN